MGLRIGEGDLRWRRDVKRTSRKRRTAALLLGTCLTSVMATAPDALGAESASLRVLSVKLDPPAIVGRPAELRVLALAGKAPVSGLVVRFGREDSFGLSACLVSSSGTRRPAGPFAPGSTVTFAVPHVFRGAGAREVLVRLDAGGCAAPGPSTFQPLIVTATRPGERIVPPTVLDVPLPGPGVPPLPGADLLPPTGLAPGPLLGVPSAGAARGPRCPGANQPVGRSARSVRAARKALLCLLNAQRQRQRLRPLRANAQLGRAATGHSRAMVLRRFFSHWEPNGPSLVARVRRAHYLAGARGWTIGENIGYGRGRPGAPAGMVRSWMRSSGHRANILYPGFRAVGLGIVGGVPGRQHSRGATYTTDFGVRR
jgi:uncharacterized protein YkwD